MEHSWPNTSCEHLAACLERDVHWSEDWQQLSELAPGTQKKTLLAIARVISNVTVFENLLIFACLHFAGFINVWSKYTWYEEKIQGLSTETLINIWKHSTHISGGILTQQTGAMPQIRRTSFAIIRNFSKFTRSSIVESLPRWMNVKSFFTNGKNGICKRTVNEQQI